MIARLSLLAVFATMTACLPAEFPVDPPASDGDGDGFGPDVDCDDGDAAVNPDAVELCDGVDQDCDTVIDDDPSDGSEFFADVDEDGYGDEASAAMACEAGDGLIALGGDCDDDDDDVNPGAGELCNGVDDDCDETTDEDANDGELYYADEDGDGAGTDATMTAACADPGEGWAVTGDDCADDDATRYPGAVETCEDPVDLDCDGAVTFVDADADEAADCVDCNVEDDTIGAPVTWYVDGDDDGFGDDGSATTKCVAPSSAHVDVGGDCADEDPAINPDAAETCSDLADLDCDGTVSGVDADNDTVAECDDCDDTESDSFPGADELCGDDRDNDCDKTADEADAVDAVDWFFDDDGDGYGVGAATHACDAPSADHVTKDGDCADDDVAFHPNATETCDDLKDFNCDGSSGLTDADKDGSPACADCDDKDKDAHPGGTEVCDADDSDEDCDGKADDADSSVTGQTSWYADTDKDGFGAGTATKACVAPSGAVDVGGDCNDGASAIKPTADEVCDPADVDENCNKQADEADATLKDGVTHYPDADKDGFGDAAATGTLTCAAVPAGRVTTKTDCDDAYGGAYPGAFEQCDGRYNDCKTRTSWLAATEDRRVTVNPGTAGAADATTAWTSGTASAPAVVSVQGAANTKYAVCDGTYLVKVTTTAATVGTQITGRNATGAVLSGGTGGLPVVDLAGGTVTIKNVQITSGNGGVRWGPTGTLTLDNVQVTANHATGDGGGIRSTGGTVSLVLSTVALNLADGKGAGIFLTDASLTLDRSTIRANDAIGAGGGIYLDAVTGSPAITCTGTAGATGGGVFDNGASSGGGLFLAGTGWTVASTTCDWGTVGVDDNDPNDIVDSSGTIGTYSVDATFTCAAGACP